MERAVALRALGVDDATPPSDVRARYLELLRRHHPDVAGDTTTVDVATITEAYRVITTTTPSPPRPRAVRIRVASDGDTLSVGMPGPDTFIALVEAAHMIGSIAYIDADAGLLEAVIVLTTGVTCSLVMTLQGRATGVTDVFCTVEPLGATQPPPVDAVVSELANIIDDHLNS